MKNDRRNLKRFEGQWVAFRKDTVIAHGKNVKKVYEQAIKIYRKPSFFLVPENIDMEFL